MGRPGDSFGDMAFGQFMSFEYSNGDPGDFCNIAFEVVFRAYTGPVLREEINDTGCNELLQSSSSGEPSAITKPVLDVENSAPTRVEDGVYAGDVNEVDVADFCVSVPLEHGVDGLR
jgi:hypothetical protein